MTLTKKIKVELDQTDAAIAAVLLAEQAGRQALKALLADKAARIGGTTNREGSRARRLVHQSRGRSDVRDHG